MKADAKFLRYSEQEWQAISAEVSRLSESIDQVQLRNELEELGRDYVSAPVAPDAHRLKFLDAKESQIAEFRRQVIEAGELPSELQKRADEVVAEIERHYQDRAIEFYHACEAAGVPMKMKHLRAGNGYYHIRYVFERSQNAHLRQADSYFGSLIAIWLLIGGDWGKLNAKPLRAFIMACARPVMGPSSITERAIADRLYRRDRRRLRPTANEN
jgi:hypothetical protein